MEPITMTVAAAVALVVKAAEVLGEKLLDRAADVAADDTVSFGQRIVRRALGKEEAPAEVAVRQATADLVTAPDDPDVQAALRVKLRQLLEADADARADVEALVRKAPQALTVIGERAAGVQGSGNTVITGDTTVHRSTP